MLDIPQFILERAHAKEAIFTADEVATWPDGLFDELLADGVLEATNNASSATCDACGHDHVEVVVYIQSPPGTGLRAYIACPEAGRVPVPLDHLRRWIVNKGKLAMPTLATVPRSPTPFPAVTPSGVVIPHALAVAHATLTAALDEAIDMYKRNLRFPGPAPVIDAIERFVHELHLVPEWFAELERRAALVEKACAPGSAYDEARRHALDSYTLPGKESEK